MRKSIDFKDHTIRISPDSREGRTMVVAHIYRRSEVVHFETRDIRSNPTSTLGRTAQEAVKELIVASKEWILLQEELKETISEILEEISLSQE